MTRVRRTHPHRRTRPPSLGDRVRQLRIARGLTQTDLAGDRFSKEYVSQIERGKTRPTAETIEWLAARLGVDSTFLEIGVSSSERERVESVIAAPRPRSRRAEYEEAVAELDKLAPVLATVAAPELELRALLAEAWSRMYLGEVRKAIEVLDRGRGIAEEPTFSDVDRAEVLYHLAAAGTSSTRSRPRWRSTRRRSSSPSARRFPPTASARTSTSGARAATSASATGRPRRRTPSARSSSPRASTTATRWANAYFQARSSPSAPATGCSRARTRRRPRRSTRSSATRRTSASSSTRSAP